MIKQRRQDELGLGNTLAMHKKNKQEADARRAEQDAADQKRMHDEAAARRKAIADSNVPPQVMKRRRSLATIIPKTMPSLSEGPIL